RGVIDLSQRLLNRGRMDANGPRLRFGIGEVEHQRLNVAVENDANKLTLAVYHGAARVTADDVRRAHKFERRIGLDLILGSEPALRQLERFDVAVLFGVLEGAAHGRPG